MKKQITVKVGTPVTTNGRYGECISYNDTVCVYVESKLFELVPTLQKLQNQYGKEYSDLHLDTVADCGCYYNCSCSPSLYLFGTREETDLEYEFRLKQEEKMRIRRENDEREQFERLSAKFGKSQGD